ncbi:MAG: AAA family ATPase, partial [Alphaproteobacteria bacterium]|nr:AAA family ATPase [Alphaproteobacteria bacterium]
KVIDELNLNFESARPPLNAVVISQPGVIAARSEDDRFDVLESGKFLKAFREKLTIERDPIAYVLSIGYTSDDREEAALVANTIAKAYLADRHQRAREQDNLLLYSARVIGPAEIPVNPSNASGVLLLGFTAAASCTFGVGLAFVLELLRRGYHNAVEVEKDLGHPVLGLVPTVHWTGTSKSQRWEILETFGLTEAIRNLVHAVSPKVDREGRDSAKVLAITSSFPDEGKSTIALGLARQAALSGLKTLLIEGDLRKPGMREGMNKIELGLVDILRGHVRYADDAIVTEPESGVDVILGMGPTDDAFTLMRSGRMSQLLQAASPRYDLIVIDTAPIMAVSETRILVDLADETLFIVRWKTTERSAARAAMRDLERMDARIAGLLLTQVNLREHLKYEDTDRLAYQEKYNQYAQAYYKAKTLP